jgi:FtsP/CotA-like multicopper oxidase with cupredoxin domain
MSHNGRVGNTVTINGQIPDIFAVQSNERIRLRLINAANARIFELDFGDHEPVIIALDGQPVTPHAPANNRIVVGPAMRVDLVLDMTAKPNSRSTITDVFYEGLEYQLIDIQYGNSALRSSAPEGSMALPSNPLPEPQGLDAVRHDIQFTGGMMGHMVMQQMGVDSNTMPSGGMGSMMNMMHNKSMWFINGVAAEGHVIAPLLTLEQNRSYIFTMTNVTAWHHPIHLHGHSFRVISRNGSKTPYFEWQDTVLMGPRERIEIAFVADNPGDWMFHCHILEHMAAGMMGVIRVT